jgi:type IV secretion system protein VirB10
VSAPPPTRTTDPRQLASVVVQRVGRAPLVLGGTVLLLALWTGAFLLSENKQKPRPAQPPSPPASAETDPGTRELLQRFLAEARRQAAQDAAAQTDRYPSQDFDDFSGVAPSPRPASQQAEILSTPPSEAPQEYRPSYSPRPEPPQRDPSQARLERALEAPPMVSLSRSASGTARTDASSSMGDLLEATERLARLAQEPPPGAPSASASPAVLRPDLPVSPSPVASISALSPLTLAAGSLIPAVLTSTVNSDSPGSVSAVVSHDVFDSLTGRSLLIPAGSHLLGSSGAASQGQNRLEIVWSRLALPNGTTYQLGAMPAADPAGATGLQDRTNRHLARTFGAALLLSAFSAGAQLSQPDAYSGALRTPSAQEVAAGALGQQVNATAGALIDRELRVPPTLVIRSGTGCNVVVSTDLVFPGPYAR